MLNAVNAEPSNISHADAYIPYALHTRRICSAKLYVLRTGRHGGQREQRSLAHHPRSCAENDNFGSSGKAYSIVIADLQYTDST